MQRPTRTEADPESTRWATTHFAGADLSDVRRVRRAIRVAGAMADRTGRSIPALFVRRYDIKAAYNFFDNPDATPDHIQAGHRKLVGDGLRRPGVYLLIEDTTVISYPLRRPIPGLGTVGYTSRGQTGFHLHTALATRWPGPARPGPGGRRPVLEVLGIADQQYDVWPPRPADAPYRRRPPARKPTDPPKVWERTTERIGSPPEAAGVRWVRVCDREADIYEFLRSCRRARHGFVVRAARDRIVVDPATGRPDGSLRGQIATAPALGQFDLELPPRPGRAARVARLSVSAVDVALVAPRRMGRVVNATERLACTAVRVWEEHPPENVAPLEWVLMCDAPVEGRDAAVERALQYSARWLVEEYHKALKTGLGAERLQLETAGRLFAAVAIMAVVAWRLIALKEQLRSEPEAPAERSGLDRLELEVLRRELGRPIGTVREVALAVGRLGGHMNRKRDGMPGWQTLWIGMLRLRTLVEGARLGRDLRFGE